jgi:gliding motility-associated-like protein
MKRMENGLKSIFFLLLIPCFNLGYGQVTIERSVIGSAGSDADNGNIKITSTIGEPIINTGENSPRFYTQGFQQPVRIVDEIFYSITIEDATCVGVSNGFASISDISGCNAPYTILWSNGATGELNTRLTAGDYSVQITSADGCNTDLYNFTIGTISNSPCAIKFYSGITPNGDGVNDKWFIDSLESYTVNEVNIYNRLGNRVWKGVNYDNINVVWSGENLSGGESPSDTYFFVFEAKGILEKGWIELTR